MGMIEERNQQRREERIKEAMLKKENQELKKHGGSREPIAKIDPPDTSSIEQVVKWHFEQTLHLLSQMSKKDAAARLRALNGSIDSFCKLKRLANDSEELENLKRDLDQLKAELLKESKLKVVAK